MLDVTISNATAAYSENIIWLLYSWQLLAMEWCQNHLLSIKMHVLCNALEVFEMDQISSLTVQCLSKSYTVDVNFV